MINTFSFLPDPGIAYDISKLLFVKLNSFNTWKELLTTVDSPEEHTKYIEEYSSEFPAPPIEALLFAYIPTNKKTTFLSLLISSYIASDVDSFTIERLLHYFDDTIKVRSELLAYYLGDHDFSSPSFEQCIRYSKTIPDKIKVLLFGFSYNPDFFITQIKSIISNYAKTIRSNIKRNDLPHHDLLNNFTSILTSQSYSKEALKKHNSFEQSIRYSLCYCTLDFLYHDFMASPPYFITTLNTIILKINNNTAFSTTQLLQSLHALSDSTRMEIIKILKDSPEVTANELAAKLSISITATHYHLAFLKKTNLILSKRRDRNVYYSYNPSGFENIINALQNFKEGDNQT